MPPVRELEKVNAAKNMPVKPAVAGRDGEQEGWGAGGMQVQVPLQWKCDGMGRGRLARLHAAAAVAHDTVRKDGSGVLSVCAWLWNRPADKPCGMTCRLRLA